MAFANELTDLLNQTVCGNVRLTASVDKAEGVVVVQYRPTKTDLLRMEGIPVSLAGKTAPLYIGLQMRLRPDSSGKHLMVVTSVMLLCTDIECSEELLHYDFEREKADSYPEAHLQVCATSPTWERLLKGRPLKRLHLPVGGRRFRPTLEDLIEFLVVEKLAEGRPGWRTALEKSRYDFQMIQLRAAIRRHPEVARDAVAALDRGD
ncbi:hypothetical protein [Nocardia sp. NPDC058666]|uniref:hypothetical protein n=1 Tax=Nocardia sp. NPDC058666 TaxID=3346587 RepID=UPI003649C6ED